MLAYSNLLILSVIFFSFCYFLFFLLGACVNSLGSASLVGQVVKQAQTAVAAVNNFLSVLHDESIVSKSSGVIVRLCALLARGTGKDEARVIRQQDLIQLTGFSKSTISRAFAIGMSVYFPYLPFIFRSRPKRNTD
jgi:type III secretory pathway component EscR